MTSTNKLKYIQKATKLNINKQQLNITLNKTELAAIIAEALTDETAGASIKRVLNPFLANSFPQFPSFTNISLGATSEDGSTVVTLREPKVKAEQPETVEPGHARTRVGTRAFPQRRLGMVLGG